MTQTVAQPVSRSFLFTKELNAFARKYLTHTGAMSALDTLRFPGEYARVTAELAEALVLHDGVALDVYGENVPLALMIKLFGVKGVEALFEQDALDFVLETTQIMHLVSPMPGVYPLMHGGHDSPPHSDPEQSAMTGLRWLSNPLAPHTARALARKAADRYRLHPQGLAAQAVQIARTAYEGGVLRGFGLPPEIRAQDLSPDAAKKFGSLAQQVFDVTLIAVNGYDAIQSVELFQILEAERDRVRQLASLGEAASHVFTIENMPSLARLVRTGALDAMKIPGLRVSSDAVAFRAWLRNLDAPTDAARVAADYMSAVLQAKERWNSISTKVARAVVVTALSAGVGALVEPLGTVAGLATGVGLSLFDALTLERLREGWSPRHFVDAVRKSARPPTA